MAVQAKKQKFKANDYVVYPAHGVGKVAEIEEEEIAGITLELYVVDFEKEKMRLRVPTAKASSVGMRKLCTKDEIEHCLGVLDGRPRIKRTMWSRRAQEYEAKINSGDLVQVSEVVRDLFRTEEQPEQSYSERQLYEAALDRMCREVAVVKKFDDKQAIEEIEGVMRASKNRAPKAAKTDDSSEAAA
jgi:CarD family transcriptional regulator